jgi:hypothetical protein
MVAKGTSSNPEQIGKMLKRVRKAVAPDVEDEILLDMLERNYEIDDVEHNQTENFLAVVRLEKHRPEPLDEATALILSQSYGRYSALYPYLSSLPPLNSNELTRLFKSVKSIEQVDSDAVEAALGQFHGIISLLTILNSVRGIPENDTVSILLFFFDGFAAAKQPREFARVTLDTLQRIVDVLPGSTSDSADAKLLRALAGPSEPTSFRIKQQFWNVNRAEWKERRISGVLTAQTATPIQVLLTLYRNAQALITGKTGTQQSIRVLEETSEKLLEVTLQPLDRLTDNDRERMIAGRPREIAKIVESLKKEATKNNSKSLPKLANEYIEELTPYLKISLVAWTYAYYASPADLIVSTDRYFVRRHQFYSPIKKQFWKETEVRNASFNSGIYLGGGLAQIAVAAGQWGLSQTEQSESIRADLSFELPSRAQLAAIRSVPWANVSTEALHLAALQLRMGRELLVSATADESVRRLIGERLVGAVGNFRRLAISRKLAENDPRGAIEMLSSSDLFFLVEGMKDTLPALNLSNPLIAEFTKQQGSPAWTQVALLGGLHLHTYGCAHSHLLPLGPYEEFERLLQKDRISERLSHVLLNAAEAADRDGIPSGALAIIAEPVLRQFAKSVKTTDSDDWLTAIQAMDHLELLALLPELDKSQK